ncbi:TetR/AcrR family transcriptional regulator (plasmid) [Gemmobacter fulvus]|uniref:TetR/AcrR family transcriptional regulator n=1 Tax=Gemmobacter fulvus TaxID=2840474 RepID=A0A975PCG2_9RHOB|nr:TetR/AcrR family transcriptional regulator [Gemmobacter fulvus]MBT9248099.1 TetR/AcrR family transcriptional regulator [Gemmobacter fulvus]QWK93073.1 TetR/AcrR family transcriptional regulator [Gemmobacter fulvus]
MTDAPRRLSRQEQQQRTRECLLDAVEMLFAEGGVNATSLRNVCERAGFSQGAFYSNFASKQDLLLSVLERHIEREAALLQSLVKSVSSDTLDHALEGFSEHLTAIAEQTQWSLLAIELQLQAQRDADFAAQCAHARNASYDALASVLETLKTRFELSYQLPTRQLAISLYALWSGLVLSRAGGETISRADLLLTHFRGLVASPKSLKG